LDFGSIHLGEPILRMPFMGPSQEEVAAIVTDLIARFGLQAHDEALHLAEVATQLRFRRNRDLYRRVAREIEKSFIEAQDRLKARTALEVGEQT
jgi:hypothetical protein